MLGERQLGGDLRQILSACGSRKAACKALSGSVPSGIYVQRIELMLQIFSSLQYLPSLIRYVFLLYLLGFTLFETSAAIRLDLDWPVSSKLQGDKGRGKGFRCTHSCAHALTA